MKKLPSETIRKNNTRALVGALAAFALFIALYCLPIYEFDTILYTKKSGNTFVGDERYLAARAEVDEAAAALEAQVGGVEIREDVTERVNSKGQKTSMVAFSVVASSGRNAWDFIASGIASGHLLLIALAAAGLAALLALASTLRARETEHMDLSPVDRGMRGVACALSLLALILLPVFHFYTVRILQRELLLNIAAAPASLLNAADALLFGGQAGTGIGEMLAGLTYRALWPLWAFIPALLALLLCLVYLYKGEMRPALLRGMLYLFVVVMCVLILYPYYVMFITAFRSNAETTDMYFSNMLPTKWIWSNLLDIVNRGVPRFLLNSLLLSGGATIIALGCGIPAAYAMARMSFRGKKAFLGFVIMSQMFAPIVLLVGISRLMTALHLNDSIWGLVFINAAFNQAFAIWLLRGTFVSISPEMEQAACIDGCNTVSALVRVLLPMAAPGIVTTLIFVFINAWNEYTISTVLISTPLKKPITVGITQFSSFNMIEWQYLFASALLATIPVVVMFMFIEKHLVAGLTSGGVKG